MIKAWKEGNARREHHTATLLRAAERALSEAESRAARLRQDAARVEQSALAAHQAALAHASRFAVEPPPARLVECAAYLYEACMLQIVPSFHDAARRGYRVHAAALHSVIQDALALGEVYADSEGRVSLVGPGTVADMWDLREGKAK